MAWLAGNADRLALGMRKPADACRRGSRRCSNRAEMGYAQVTPGGGC